VTDERKHVVKYVSCEVHGRALVRSCALCRATGLTDEQWNTREAREAGEVFSAPLCTHGNPEGRCPASCTKTNGPIAGMIEPFLNEEQ